MKQLVSILGFWHTIKVFYYRVLRKQLKVQYTYPVEFYKAIHYVSTRKGKVVQQEEVVEFNFSYESKQIKAIVRKGTSDAAVFYQIFGMGEYQCLVSLVKSFPGFKVRSIIDAGANVGFTSLFLAANFPEARILGIEPDVQNFKILERNFTANVSAPYILLKKALWKNAGMVVISESFRDHREWSRQVVDMSGAEQQNSEHLEGIPLNELIKVAGTDLIDILKIDIEGAEKEVFSDYAGSIEVLKKVRFLIVELHNEVNFQLEFENMLIQSGFRFTYVGESLLGFNSNLFNS